jgi:hypothetical protein
MLFAGSIVILLQASGSTVAAPAPDGFIRGDATSDLHVDLSDVVDLLGFLFTGAPAGPNCRDAADLNDSGDIDLTDPIYLLAYLFQGGAAPPAPFPGCGVDLTPDGLGCDQIDPCLDVSLGEIPVFALRRENLPDLEVGELKPGSCGLVTNPESLEVSGRLAVDVKNTGKVGVGQSFKVLVFSDQNGNRTFDLGVDQPLGLAIHEVGVAAGETSIVDIGVSGVLPFAGCPLFAVVDSEDDVFEASETNNRAHTQASSRYMPPPGASFEPALEWAWTGSDVMPDFRQVLVTPVVANLDDDNGDGNIDAQDVPDIVFGAMNSLGGEACSVPAILRAISGDGSGALFDITDPSLRVLPCCPVAIGDLDGDHVPEIVAAGAPPSLLIFHNDGTLKLKIPEGGQGLGVVGGPSLADLDGDGLSEIIASGVAYDQSGKRLFGRDFPVIHGALSFAADLDLDGQLEVVNGLEAFDLQGRTVFSYPPKVPGYNGRAAVGNFDEDPFPEVAVVAPLWLYLLEHDGTIKWSRQMNEFSEQYGGPPVVADFDGDGTPEIGFAATSSYRVFGADGSLRWTRTIRDPASGFLGSAGFDFDGDGSAEVVVNDEHHLRILRGTDGTVIYETVNPTCTGAENPVIADVDNDGNAEIVVCRNENCGYAAAVGITNSGIFVFGDANDNWVRTRRIWNQHAYSITNVNEDGTIPAKRVENWLAPGLNDFRSNVPLPGEGSLYDAPDLLPSVIRIEGDSCPDAVTLVARVGSGGAVAVSPGIRVAFYHGPPGSGGVLIGSTLTTVRLPEGAFEDVSVTWTNPPSGNQTVVVVVDEDASGLDPNGRENEGNEDNNSAQQSLVVCERPTTENQAPRALDLSVSTDADAPACVLLRGSDPESAPLSYEIATFTTGGRLSGVPPTLTYTPNPGFIGTDTLTYTVSDGDRESSLAAVTIKVGALGDLVVTDLLARVKPGKIALLWTPIPEAASYNIYRRKGTQPFVLIQSRHVTSVATYLDQPVNNGSTYVYSVRWVDSDGRESGPSSEISATPTALGSNAAPVITTSPVPRASVGEPYVYEVGVFDPDGAAGLSFSLKAAPAGMVLDPLNGRMVWRPALSQIGSHSVAVEVKDPRGLSARQAFTIKVLFDNDPPRVTSTPPATAVVGVPYVYDVEADDPDPEDRLVFRLTLAPEGMVIDRVSGRITWTPTLAQAGAVEVSAEVRDGGGLFAMQAFRIGVAAVNLSPRITSAPPTTGAEGILYSYSVTASDPNPGDALSFNLNVKPAGMGIDPRTGGLSWIPGENQTGRHPVTVVVTDRGGLRDTQAFEITVLPDNDAPRIVSAPVVRARENCPPFRNLIRF